MNNGLYSFPYYPVLVGVEIPVGSTHGKTTSIHALLYGAISVHAGNNADGCFASLECLANELNISTSTVKSRMKDLENLGWVEIRRNKNGEYTNAFPLLIIGKVPSDGNEGSFRRERGVVPTGTNLTPVATPVLNNNNKEQLRNPPTPQMGEETFSTCSQGKSNGAAVTPPAFSDIVDLKKVEKTTSKNYGALTANLLRESGMKGEVTSRLVNQVRRMEKIYGEKKLHDVVKAVRYDKFWVTQGLVSLMKQENIERVMNRDNKPEDPHHKSHSTGIRREI